MFKNCRDFLKRVCCYLDQNPKRKGSLSPSNFDGKMPNVLFPYLCICVRAIIVVTVAIPKYKGIYITSFFDGPLNCLLGEDYF